MKTLLLIKSNLQFPCQNLMTFQPKKYSGQQFFFNCPHILAIFYTLNIFNEKNNLEKIFRDNAKGIV
jgi:hypothetical protein